MEVKLSGLQFDKFDAISAFEISSGFGLSLT